MVPENDNLNNVCLLYLVASIFLIIQLELGYAILNKLRELFKLYRKTIKKAF